MTRTSREGLAASALARLVLLEGPFQNVREGPAASGLDFLAGTVSGLPFAVSVKLARAQAPRASAPRVAASLPVYVFFVDVEKRRIEYQRVDQEQRTPLGQVSFTVGEVGVGRFRAAEVDSLLRDVEEFHAKGRHNDQEASASQTAPPPPGRILLSATDEDYGEAGGLSHEMRSDAGESFALRLLRSSLPLRKISHDRVLPSSPVPVGYASSCLVRYRGVLTLFTVAHGLREGIWAIEVDADYDAIPPQTRLKPLSAVHYMSLATLAGAPTAKQISRILEGGEPERVSEIDFALKPFKPGELDQHPKLQMVIGRTPADEIEIGEAPRLVFASSLNDEPVQGDRYGFAGLTRPAKKVAGGTTTIEFQTECVTDLQFISSDGDFLYRFRSQNRERRFDKSYRGCSGAPILDEDGRLVSLVVEGSGGRDLFGLNLRRLRSAVDAALQHDSLALAQEQGAVGTLDTGAEGSGDSDTMIIAEHPELDPWRDPEFFSAGSLLTGRVVQAWADKYLIRIPGPLRELLDKRLWADSALTEGDEVRLVVAESDPRNRSVRWQPYSRDTVDADVQHIRPKGLKNCLARGDYYLGAGEHDAAVREYRRALDFGQKRDAAAVWLKIGVAIALGGDRKEAIVSFNRAIKLEAGLAAAIANRGIARQEEGDLDQALADLSRAVELQRRAGRERAHAHNGLGVVLELRGELQEALRAYDRAIELDGRLPQVWSNRAGLKESLGDLDGAIDDCATAINIARHRPAPYRVRARALFQKAVGTGPMRMAFESIADATRAIDLDPEDSEAWNTRGIAWWLAGDLRRAVPDLRQAVALARPAERTVPSDNLQRATALLEAMRPTATAPLRPGNEAILRLRQPNDHAFDLAA